MSGIKCIKNKDNFCLIRAILVGKAYADHLKNAYTLLRDETKILDKKEGRIVRAGGFQMLEQLSIEHLK